MSDPIAAELARAADSEAPREERARDAAAIVRSARGYRSVAIYDAGDDEISPIGSSGPPVRPFTKTPADRTVVEGRGVVVPILGPESGIVMGALQVERDGDGAFPPGDVAFLEECAAALRPLYD